MGKRGPKPVPTKILEARGSWRANRPEEPDAAPGVPQCPGWLAEFDPFAAEVWRDVMPLLVAQGTVAQIDWLALASLCQNFSLWRRSAELVECAEPGTPEWRRLYSTANQALGQVLRLSSRFGLTPADRAGLHVEKEDKPKESGKSRFFFGAG